MRSLLRALVVMLAVTVAGTALPSVAGPVALRPPADEGQLDVARATARTPTETAIQGAAIQEAAIQEAAKPTTLRRQVRMKRKPLRSITIALDPGHQLGNAGHPNEINAPVPAGGFTKPCNSTGTATDSGVAEATVNFQLSRAVEKRLRQLGARVVLTRSVNNPQLWGPCVDWRGQFGRRVGARLMVSLHADGSSASARGFHVIAPTARPPWTSDIAASSLRLATSLRNGLTAAGVPRSNYIGQGTGLNVRDDLGTLNMSDVPVAMVEIGNMRNAGDASRMTSRSGQAHYARAVVRGIRSFLGR